MSAKSPEDVVVGRIRWRLHRRLHSGDIHICRWRWIRWFAAFQICFRLQRRWQTHCWGRLHAALDLKTFWFIASILVGKYEEVERLKDRKKRFFPFLLLTWNQILIWVGVRFNELANVSRSGAERYFCSLKRRSSSTTCDWEKRMRGFRLDLAFPDFPHDEDDVTWLASPGRE